MSKADPKHGRWILPLVVAGLVLFTYLFVNALPPGPSGPDGGDGDGTGVDGTTAPTEGDGTTTTQVDDETAAFLTAIDDFSSRSTALAEEAQSLNDAYDAEEIEFGEIRDGLTELQDDTDALAAEIADFDVLPSASDAWADVVAASTDMATAAAEMLDGLVNTAGADKRLAELANYQTAATELATALGAAADAA